MRDYFLNLLQNLDKLTGMKQYEKLLQMPDYKKEINTLLDILCRVADQYAYIPDAAKQGIIHEAVISDPEFIGLNAKFIARALNLKREFYMKEKDDVVISPDALTGEAREKRLKEWQEALSRLEVTVVERIDPYKTVREQWQPKEGTEPYRATVDEKGLYEKERHLKYIAANYHPKTGKPTPDWIPEDEWNIQYDNEML